MNETYNDIYYKPHISEFYVGFEYEFCAISKAEDPKTKRESEKKEWLPRIIGEGVWDLQKQVKNFLAANRIRVKYLDKSDILALGWESDQNAEPSIYFFRDGKERGTLTLRHESALGMLYIFNNEIGVGYYYGKCLNKNQLKTIMKYLGLNGTDQLIV